MGRAMTVADCGCVAGETIINTPHGDYRIDELARLGKPIRVWSLNSQGEKVAAIATAPFEKGVEDLWQFQLFSGRSIITTNKHRFLTKDGWSFAGHVGVGVELAIESGQSLSSPLSLQNEASISSPFEQGSSSTSFDPIWVSWAFWHFLKSFSSPLQTILGSALSTLLPNVQNLKRIIQDFQSCYPPSFCFCDGRLPLGLNIYQGTFPLPTDARKPCHNGLHVGGLGSRYIDNFWSFLLSKNGLLPPSETCSLVDGGCQTVSLKPKHYLCSDLGSLKFQRFLNLVKPILEFAGLQKHRNFGVSSSPKAPLSWDCVIAINYIRKDRYYDMHVPGFENYLANGIWNHNTGKSLIELVIAENMARKTKGNTLLLTPLAVGAQMLREAEKFGVKATRTKDGKVHKGINITNYQQLHKFNPKDFTCVIGDEGGVIKSFEGETRKLVTQFMAKVPYAYLLSAKPAPNDHMELGTSSEALGVMPRNQMLGMFFTNDGGTTQKWRLKGHAKKRFWQWVATWTRAVRKPSDLGDYDDSKYVLPELKINLCKVEATNRKGFFPKLAVTLDEQRHEKRISLDRRCEEVVKRLPKDRPSIIWCQLNSEGDALTKAIDGAVQVTGSDSDDKKEELLNAFSLGQIQRLVTKAQIAGFGLNWQHCADIFYFPDHSHEKYYQAVRRSYRFGQKNRVNVNLIYTESEALVLSNMMRKERQSEELYAGICREVNAVIRQKEVKQETKEFNLPTWLR